MGKEGTHILEDPSGSRRIDPWTEFGLQLQRDGDGKEASWSQFGQDLFIDSLFRHMHHGTFVEIGAHNGEDFSNSLLLERARGWDGVLIEVNPFSFEELRRKDRLAWMVNGCLSMSAEMRFRLYSSLTTATDERSSHSGDLYLARCTTMRAILEQTAQRVDSSGRFRIDVLFLDAEGSELQVLRSIDWDWVGISVIVVEDPTSGLVSRFSERSVRYDFHAPVPALHTPRDFCQCTDCGGGRCCMDRCGCKPAARQPTSGRLRCAHSVRANRIQITQTRTSRFWSTAQSTSPRGGGAWLWLPTRHWIACVDGFRLRRLGVRRKQARLLSRMGSKKGLFLAHHWHSALPSPRMVTTVAPSPSSRPSSSRLRTAAG